MNVPRSLFVLFAWSLLLVIPADGAAQPEAASAVATSEPAAEGAAAGEARGQRRRREVPKAMVLCRGPRGAVYARDVNEGCRNARLDASNLVDFGGGEDCLLRKASAFDPKNEKTAAATNCDGVCAAADSDRGCVVALTREGKAWETFGPDRTFPAGESVLRDATVVCCR